MKAKQNGGLVIVRADDGRKVATYNAVRLTKELIQLGEARFFLKYGFRWTPTNSTITEAKRQMDAAR